MKIAIFIVVEIVIVSFGLFGLLLGRGK